MKSVTTTRSVALFALIAVVAGATPLARGAQLPTESQGRTAPVGGDEVESAGEAEIADHARELRRVLSLAGGGFVRAKSRLVDGRWEYLDGTSWNSLSADRVVRVEVERELLARAKQLAADLGRDDARRAAYADWLCGAGLLSEGVKELDLLLTREPDSSTALDTCAKLADFVRVSSADARSETGLTEWLRAAAGYGPAMREVTVHQLRERTDAAALTARLAHELAADSPRTRAFAALALRRISPGAELRGLASRAVLDGSESVRREAALSLKAAEEPATVAPVVRALGSQHAAVRANAVEALGAMQYPSAIEPLIGYLTAISAAQAGGWKPPAASIFVGRQIAYVQDYDVEVAQFAAVADPQVNTLVEGAVLDVRIISAYSVNPVADARRVREALQKLTHANPGETAAAWGAWWQANRARFEPDAPRTRAGS